MSNTLSSNKYDLIVFDLDGTILDTIADLSDSVCFALKENGFPPRTEEEVKSFVGNGVLKLVERALPDGAKDPETVKRVYDCFNTRYAGHYADKTRPYCGMAELLKSLKAAGYKLAVLSNKPDKFTKELIEKFYGGLFDIVEGSGENTPRKPDPTGELNIISRLGASPEKTVHIGDSDTDVMTAKNSGAALVACSWGYRSRETLERAGAKLIADSVEELGKIFLENS